jgi:hypothetical protein
MPLNDVKFEQVSGLGNVEIGKDSASALFFPNLVAPSIWGGDRVKLFYSAKQAAANGIFKGSVTYGLVYYHIVEFFRVSPGAKLYVIFQGINIIEALTVNCEGEPRQVGVLEDEDINRLANAYQEVAVGLELEHCPNVQFVASMPNLIVSVQDVQDLAEFNCPNVAVLACGSGSGQGWALAKSFDYKATPSLGAVLGLVSRAKVHESIAWVGKFKVNNGVENEVIVINDNIAVTREMITALNDKHYLIFRKHVGIAGTYLADSFNACPADDDYAYIERNRVMGKAKRLLRRVLLPYLNAPLYLEDNKLAIGTINLFKGLCDNALVTMASAGELSEFSVVINPNQNVLLNNTLAIELTIVPVGVARNIVVEIGYAVKVA